MSKRLDLFTAEVRLVESTQGDVYLRCDDVLRMLVGAEEKLLAADRVPESRVLKSLMLSLANMRIPE